MTKKTSAANESIAYPVLPLRDIVVFPHMIVPLFVGRASLRAPGSRQIRVFVACGARWLIN